MTPRLDAIVITEDDMALEYRHLLTAAEAAATARRGTRRPSARGGGGKRFYRDAGPGALPHGAQLGSALLATALSRAGRSVELVENWRRDPGQSRRLDRLLTRRPRLVAVCTTFIFTEETLAGLRRRVRLASPDTVMLLGGPGVLQFPEMARHADAWAWGEGEELLPRVVAALRDGEEWRAFPGLNGARAPLLPAAAISSPDWGLARRGPDEVYPLETQRGCPYKCRYCTYPVYSPGTESGDGLRLRPLDDVVREAVDNRRRWGIRNYFIVDSTFTFPARRTEEFCRALTRRRLGLRWSCYARADNLTPSLASAMVDAGCRSVHLGIETGSPRMLERMRKDFTVEQSLTGLEICRKAGLVSTCSLIVGFPGETSRTLEETRDFLVAGRPDLLRIGAYWHDPNSPGARTAVADGLTGRGNRWRHRTMDSAEAASAARRLLADAMTGGWARLGSAFHADALLNAGLGLAYDEALGYVLDKSLLAARRLARAAGASPLPYAAEASPAARRVEALEARMMRGATR